MIKEAVTLFVSLTCAEWQIEVLPLGSTTFVREDAERGFEADSCFYLTNERLIRGKDRIDLPNDPPPDLVFEIDVTSSSLDKDSIFAQFGVPEVWRYDGETMEFLVHSGSGYERAEVSSVLPLISAEVLLKFVAESIEGSRLEWIKNVREWAQEVNISNQA
jgi:Uma2 family endonuclease